MTLRVMKESRSNNYKENTAFGFDAIQHALELLFSTPIGSMPFAIGYGFELKDLLFRESGSEGETRVMADFNTQVRALAGNSDIDVNFSRDGSTVNLVIEYTYGHNEYLAKVPIADLGNHEYRLSFDDIIVK